MVQFIVGAAHHNTSREKKIKPASIACKDEWKSISLFFCGGGGRFQGTSSSFRRLQREYERGFWREISSRLLSSTSFIAIMDERKT